MEISKTDVDFEDIHGVDAMQKAYYEAGITPKLLAENDLEALKSVSPKRIKVKGHIVPKGRHVTVIGTSGVIEFDKDGERFYGDGETILEFRDINGSRRDRAVERIQRVCDHLPAVKQELDSTMHVLVPEDIPKEVPK